MPSGLRCHSTLGELARRAWKSRLLSAPDREMLLRSTLLDGGRLWPCRGEPAGDGSLAGMP